MKYALVNGSRKEATKGAKGKCINCEGDVIAKCGNIVIHHWAHIGDRDCDSWGEGETEWHRSWKNNYSKDWQEISLLDKIKNERHIADIRTVHGLVLEFQHSHIEPNERVAREKFHNNMFWVVDGTRLKEDYPRFQRGISKFRLTNSPTIFHVDFIHECFHTDWINSSVPVIFDFKGIETINDTRDNRNHLFCLLPKKNNRSTVLVVLSRKDFIETTINGELIKLIKNHNQ